MCLFVSISMSRLLSPHARKSILASPEDEAVVLRERLSNVDKVSVPFTMETMVTRSLQHFMGKSK